MSEGNTILTEAYKGWPTATGSTVYGWVANANSYDIDGRLVKAWQATYVDGSTSNPHPLSVTVISAQSADGTQPATPDQITVNATASTSTPPTLTSYTPDGQTLTTTDQYNGVTTNIYDASGHLIETQYPDGTETISVYDTLGRVILATDKFVPGQSAPILATRTVYDSLGQTIATQRVSGVSITVSPDPSYGSLFAITAVTGAGLINSNPTDPAEGTWSLDLSGNWAVNAATPAYYSQSQTVYDAQGQAVETDSPSGLRTGTVYYADGSVEYTGPLNSTAPATWYLSANPLPSFSSYTKNVYDQTDNLPAGAVSYDAVTDPLGHTTKTYMDPSGRTIETRYDDGSLTQTIYSVGDQAISGYAVYVGGTAAAPSIPAGGSETVNIAQHMPGDSNVGYTIDVYDASGNLVDVYQPAVPDPAYGYAAGLLTSPHTHYDYDAGGNEKSMTDANGNTTQFSYDANGNQTGQTLPMNQTSSNIYNQYGQLDHSFDFKGNETKYAYDSQGRVQTISYYPATNLSAADDVVTYTYTPLGQVSTINDSSTGRTDTYSYDASGDMIEDQSVQGGLTQTVYHTYDQATGLLVRTWTADGASNETFTYDTQGRLSTVTSGTQVTTYAYDPNGNLHSTTTVNGSTTTVATNTYDDLNRLTDLTNTLNGTIISEYSYTLDHAGNRIQAVETVDGTMQTVNYTYDADNRLTEEKYTVGGSVTLKIDYAYDLDGNRTIETQSGNAATAPGTTTSSYNANNELTNIESPTGSYTFKYYDANGSLISTATATSLTGTQTTTATYTFNDRNQLVADSVNGNTDSYAYDSNGDRISATTNGTTTDYEFDTASPTGYDQVLAETSTTGAVQVKYVWGMQIVSETNGSTTSLYELDGHGSVRQLVNAGSHAVTDMYYYDAFGNLLASSGSTSNVYRFAGMRLDGWSGAYDDAARYYTPQTGEFISRDGDYGSSSDPISLHKYLYAGGNPINAWDPSGHDLTELLVDMGIDSVLNSAVSFALKPAIGYVTSALASALIPQSALNAIENALPNVGIIGAGLALNVAPSGGFGASFEGALEGVYSSHTNHGALFLADTEKLGLIGGDPGAVNFVVGLGWNVADSEDYTENKYGVSFPFAGLPSKIQSRIQADLTNRLGSFVSPFLSQLSAGASALDSAFPGYSSGLINSIESDLPSYTAGILHFLDKCEATVLTNGNGVEVVLGYNALEEANSSESARYTGAGIVHASATQLYPSEGNVPFE